MRVNMLVILESTEGIIVLLDSLSYKLVTTVFDKKSQTYTIFATSDRIDMPQKLFRKFLIAERTRIIEIVQPHKNLVTFLVK